MCQPASLPHVGLHRFYFFSVLLLWGNSGYGLLGTYGCTASVDVGIAGPCVHVIVYAFVLLELVIHSRTC